VWGRVENNVWITIPPKIISEFFAQISQNNPFQPPPDIETGPFKFCDLNYFRKVLLDAGFKTVVGWYTTCEMSCEAEQMTKFYFANPRVQQPYSTLSESTQKQLFQHLQQFYQKELDKGTAITWECLVCTCYN